MSRDDDAELDGADVDLWQLAQRLWAGRLWVIGSTVVCAALFLAAAFLITPRYEAQTVLIPAQHEAGAMGSLSSALGQLGGLASLAGMSIGGGATQVEEALAVLRSREFTERFIEDHDLKPVLFARRWDAQRKQWREGKKVPSLADAERYFRKKVRNIAQDRKSGLVTLTIEWRDPQVAAQWANELVARLNNEMRQRDIVSSDASMRYLQKELAATSTIDTRDAINRLIGTQINRRMFANVTEEYSFRIVDRALPPDLDDEVWPNKGILLGGGVVLGLILGIAIALFKAALAERRAALRRASGGA